MSRKKTRKVALQVYRGALCCAAVWILLPNRVHTLASCNTTGITEQFCVHEDRVALGLFRIVVMLREEKQNKRHNPRAEKRSLLLLLSPGPPLRHLPRHT